MQCPTLQIVTGQSKGHTVPLAEPVVVGRRPDAGLSLQDAGISWNHARIEPKADELWIADLGSANGTFLNGKRVPPNQWTFLPMNAELAFANVRVRVKAADTPPQPAPAEVDFGPPSSARLRMQLSMNDDAPPTMQLRALEDPNAPTRRAAPSKRGDDATQPDFTPPTIGGLTTARVPTPTNKTPLVPMGSDSSRLKGRFAGYQHCTGCGHTNPPLIGFCMKCGLEISASSRSQKPAVNPATARASKPEAAATLTNRNTIRTHNPFATFLGRTISGYRIEKKLGRGAYGMVFEATQVKLKRVVAIKVLPPVLSNDAEVIKRFENEAQVVARIEHPNIVSVYDMFEAQGLFCIAMAHVPGGSLKDLIVRDGTFAEEHAARIAYETALGLWAAYEKGIVHRDIKPENLLLTEKGRVNIVDFGLAKAAELSEGLTNAGAFMGTPAYMSPEQWRDSAESDHRSDLYSLGVTLFQMLAGRPPFEGPTTPAFVEQHVLHDPPRLQELRPDLTADMCRIVHRLLEKNPDERFQTGAEVAEALRPLIEVLPLSGTAHRVPRVPSAEIPRPRARPPGAAALASPPTGRTTRLLFLLGAVVGLVWAGWWFGLLSAQKAQGFMHPKPHAWLPACNTDVIVQAGDFPAIAATINGLPASSAGEGLFSAHVRLQGTEGQAESIRCVLRAADGTEQTLAIPVYVDLTPPQVQATIESDEGTKLLVAVSANEPPSRILINGRLTSSEPQPVQTVAITLAEDVRELEIVFFDRAGHSDTLHVAR